MNNNTIKGLNSLRFFAFLMVFLFHSFPIFTFGYTGVLFFYVISGFLLTHLALVEIHQKANFSAVNFFMRRALRIYPVYFLIVGFAFLVLPILAQTLNIRVTLPASKWKYLLFLSNYDYTDHVFFLKLLWSISVEEQFYIGFILLTVFFKNFFFPLCTALGLIYFGFIYFVTTGAISHEYFNPLNYLPCFVGGMLLAKINYSNPSHLRQFLWISLGIMICGFAASGLGDYFMNAINLAIASLFTILIGLLLLKRKQVESVRLRLFRLTEYLGKMTYGLYVYSGIVITLNLTVFHIKNSFLQLLVESLILFPLAIISYKYFELPFLRLKEKWR